MNDEVKEQAVASLFDADKPIPNADDARVQSIMSRIKVETARNDIVLFVFVRMWLSVLEFGAQVYASRSKHTLKSNTPSNAGLA